MLKNAYFKAHWLIFLAIVVYSYPSVSALSVDIPVPTNYSLIPTVNSSDFWDDLNTPEDITTFLKIDESNFGFSDIWLDYSNPNFAFNEIKFNDSVRNLFTEENIIINASTVNTTVGIFDEGNLSNIQTLGEGETYNVSEVAGVPGFTININFSDVVNFNVVALRGKYEGGAGHTVELELFRVGVGWEERAEITDQMNFGVTTIDIFVGSDFIDDTGTVQFRINHDDPGNINHVYILDAIFIGQTAGLQSSGSLGDLTGRDEACELLPDVFCIDGSKAITNDTNWGGFNLSNVDWIHAKNVNVTNQTLTNQLLLTCSSGGHLFRGVAGGTGLLGLQEQKSGNQNRLVLFTKDGDGSDTICYDIAKTGTPESFGSPSLFSMCYDSASDKFTLKTNGVGALDVILSTASHEQIVLLGDGGTKFKGLVSFDNVNVSKNLNVSENIYLSDGSYIFFGDSADDFNITWDGTGAVFSTTSGDYIFRKGGTTGGRVQAESFIATGDNPYISIGDFGSPDPSDFNITLDSANPVFNQGSSAYLFRNASGFAITIARDHAMASPSVKDYLGNFLDTLETPLKILGEDGKYDRTKLATDEKGRLDMNGTITNITYLGGLQMRDRLMIAELNEKVKYLEEHCVLK